MSGKRILLVDDDTDMLMMTERWLSKDGYEVMTATTGSDALHMAKSTMPDLILLDYRMPGMDGADILYEIRNTPGIRDIPVFFLTGMEDVESCGHVEALSPQGYLPKSAGKKALLAALSSYFQGAPT